MKRSQINTALREPEMMCEKYHCCLPLFWHVTPEDRQKKCHEYDEASCRLLCNEDPEAKA